MNLIIYKLLSALINILELLIIANIILSWLRMINGTLWKISEAVEQIVNPILRPFRKFIPTIDLGGMGFDLTPIVVLILLRIIESAVLPLFLALPF